VQEIADNRRPAQLLLAAMDTTFLVAGPQELGRILDHPGFIAYAILAQLGLAITFDLYRPETWRTRDYLLARMAALGISLAVALALGNYLVLQWRFGRGLLVLTLLFSLPLQTLLRLLWYEVRPRSSARRAVVIGTGPIVGALEEVLADRPSPPFNIVRHLPAPNGTGQAMLTSEDLADADVVIVAQITDDSTADRLAALNFGGTTVVDSAGAYAALTGRIPVRQVDSRWFIATGDFSSLATTGFHHVQRLLDVVAATGLLIVTAPLLLLAAIGILISHPATPRQARTALHAV